MRSVVAVTSGVVLSKIVVVVPEVEDVVTDTSSIDSHTNKMGVLNSSTQGVSVNNVNKSITSDLD